MRIFAPIVMLATVTALGGAAIYGIGRGRWSLADSIYHAINGVTTVGFRELDGMEQVRFSHLATSLIILAGLGSVAYFQSSLTALLVQGVIGERFRTRRMQSKIDKMKDHVIVAGAGSTGVHVVEELHATRTPCVVIDRSREALERLSRELADGEMLYVVGDATDDMVLMQAGITRAKGIIAALTDDKENLFVTLSARTLNAGARIVSKVIGHDTAAKMMRAGANATVSPNMMGGRRLASELMRPTVTEFIDQMLREREEVLRLDEVRIPEGSSFGGKSLREVPIRAETKLLVVALRVEGKFIYNPEPDALLEEGNVLVVLGPTANVAKLRSLVRSVRALESQPPGAR